MEGQEAAAVGPSSKGDFIIPGQTWLAALRTVDRSVRGARPGGNAAIELASNEVRLIYAGQQVTIAAEGVGQGRAVFSGSYVRPLLAVARLSGGDPVRLRVDAAGALFIGATRIDCRWLADGGPGIDLPALHTLCQVLQLRYLHSQDALIAAGLDDYLFEAECRKADLVAQAAEILAPLGISLPELDHFVSSHVRNTRRTGLGGEQDAR